MKTVHRYYALALGSVVLMIVAWQVGQIIL
jgi:hypothetical protein